jgi:hypothetical protein
MYRNTVLAGRRQWGKGQWEGVVMGMQLTLSKGPARIEILFYVKRAAIPSEGSFLLF